MESKVVNIFPANDFKIVADNAGNVVDVGIIIGYDEEGELTIFGGGMIDGRQPCSKDWLWMVESFKQMLVGGEFSE